MTVLQLIDSRNRLVSRTRQARRFPVTWEGYAQAWRIVLDAEVRPANRDDYTYIFTNNLDLSYPHFEAKPLDNDMAEAIETFNSYWGIYGWDLHEMDADLADVADLVVVPNDQPAPETFDEPI